MAETSDLPAPEIARLIKNLAATTASQAIPAIQALVRATRSRPDQHQRVIDAIVPLLDHPRLSVMEWACVALRYYPIGPGVVQRLRQIAQTPDRVRKRNAAHRTLSAHWAKFRRPAIKPDAEAIMARLSTHRIASLFHITSASNWELIKAQGAILSKAELDRRKAVAPVFISDASSRDTDHRRLASDWIHLCFRPNQPMFLKALAYKGAKDLMILEVDPVVATWQSTLFSRGNVVECHADFGPEFTDLASIDLSVFETPSWTEATQHDWQSEVLVHESLPVSLIKREMAYKTFTDAL